MLLFHLFFLEYLQQAAAAVVSCFRALFHDIQYMSNQSSNSSAAWLLYNKTVRKKEFKEQKSDQDHLIFLPGDESRLPLPKQLNEAHQHVLSIVRMESIAKNICRALTSLDQNKGGLLVHNTIYYPSVVIREQIRNLVSQSIRTITKKDSSGSSSILRPTELLQRIKHVLSTLHRIATTSITHDVERIVREELLRNCYDHRFAPGIMGEQSTSSRNSDKGGTATDANAMVHGYGRQYIHLIETLLRSNNDSKQDSGIVWSSFKKGFISHNNNSSSSGENSIEDYATLTEWMALCELIGPQGMRCIEYSMYHIISGHATAMWL